MNVKFKYDGPFEAPKQATGGAAGIDLFHNGTGTVYLHPNTSFVFSTGFSVEIPQGYVGLVFARSSLGFKFGCTLTNSVGVIDSDYRGEIKVKVTNLNHATKTFEPGERICQLVIVPYLQANLVQVEELSETERGEKGFGSTGTK